MVAPVEDDNSSNCFFDFSLIENVPFLESDFQWSSNFNRAGFLDLSGKVDYSEEHESRKRVNPASSSAAADTKACREKRRRHQLNERFQELNDSIDHGRPPKIDKLVILGDAIRMVIQLRDEAVKLQESTQYLQAKVNELKNEKNELRDEKHILKAEKERLELQVNAFSRAPATAAFLSPSPNSPMPFGLPASPIFGSKFMPNMRYHGVPIWPFTSIAAVDTSKDHVLRSPLA